ncbi:unnamed protein product [Penicillium manginii]
MNTTVAEGDFSLVALDCIEKCGLQWIGNCNELNAGYAADGYARVNGISALMTIMGVGELSSLNAIAGSFAELIPVVHIVNMPSRRAQLEKLCVHHTFGDGDFDVFKRMTAATSCMSVTLDCPKKAAALINAALQQCAIQSRPVSIFVPSDLINVSIDTCSPSKQIDSIETVNDTVVEGGVADSVLAELRSAKYPILLLGGYGVAHDIRDEILDLINKLCIPVLSSASCRGFIEKDHYLYAGLYVGSCSDKPVVELMNSADLVLSIGNIQSDLCTAGFTGTVDQKILIDMQRCYTVITHHPKVTVSLKGVTQMMTARVCWNPLPAARIMKATSTYVAKDNVPCNQSQRSTKRVSMRIRLKQCLEGILKYILSPAQNDSPLLHENLWPRVGGWLQRGDIILTEAGTASFGIWNTTIPSETTFISQYLWASIGYTVGACQGAALAVRDSQNPKRRTILFIGDGSLQIGCQELSTIVRLGLAPIIFIICNRGYTIERFVHAPSQAYHDVQPWRYRDLPAAFGATPGSYGSHSVRTMRHLEALMSRHSFRDPSILQVVELHMSPLDAPSDLVTVAQSLKRRNQ